MADADTDYINYFEADLTATDRIYLVRFQRHIHDATNVKTMGVTSLLTGFSLWLCHDALTSAWVALFGLVWLMLIVSRPTAIWRALGIASVARQIRAQSAISGIGLAIMLVGPLLFGLSSTPVIHAMLGLEASRVFWRLLSVRRSCDEQDKEQVFT